MRNRPLEKEYWANGQSLYISTIEVLDYNSPNAGEFSVYTVNPKTEEFCTYLFDIQNYNAFQEDIWPIKKHIKYPDTFDYKSRWDVDKASCAVFYDARKNLYTLPKFTSVTREDILRCFDHYKRQKEYCCLFNVKWYEFKDEKQYEFDFKP